MRIDEPVDLMVCAWRLNAEDANDEMLNRLWHGFAGEVRQPKLFIPYIDFLRNVSWVRKPI